jgi:BirA family biotin operon repressor/biotin-[acetyl-CoA-carboxylase] ligase
VPETASALHLPSDVQDALRSAASRVGVFQHVSWYDSVGSTNDVAAGLANAGALEGTVVVAESQTAGRGRLGRVWCSPPGAGLYLSVVLRPRGLASDSAQHASLLTIAAGVAVAEGVQAATGLEADLKWPNDLVVENRKLAGILTEAVIRTGELEFAVVGIGVNLREGAYPPDVARRATSIEAELNRHIDRGQLVVEILAALSTRYGHLCVGSFDAILTAWRSRARTLSGSPVEWDLAGAVVRGRAVDIDVDGALLVRVGERIERIVAGEVRWSKRF